MRNPNQIIDNIMNSNFNALDYERETYHVRIRRSESEAKQARKRVFMIQEVYKVIQQNIADEQEFNPQTYSMLLNLAQDGPSDVFTMLGQYIQDHPYYTKDAFQALHMIKSPEPSFSRTFLISLHPAIEFFDDTIPNIQRFINSKSQSIVENGFRCIQFLIENKQWGVVGKINGLMEVMDREVYNEKIQYAVCEVYLDLLKEPKTRNDVYSEATPKHLAYLLGRNKKIRTLLFSTLHALFTDFSIEIHSHQLYSELFRLFESPNFITIANVSELFLVMMKHQRYEVIKYLFHLGLIPKVAENVTHVEIGIVSKSIGILSNFFDIVELSNGEEIIAQAFTLLETQFRLRETLENIMETHFSDKIRNKARTFLEDWYSPTLEYND